MEKSKLESFGKFRWEHEKLNLPSSRTTTLYWIKAFPGAHNDHMVVVSLRKLSRERVSIFLQNNKLIDT